MKKISVIVPVWNVEKYLPKCLNSLVNQTLKEIEIIIVNDDSPDNSQVIIDSYVKKYPNKITSIIKENGGQGSARNYGLKLAKGEYISFVDSDDWIDLKSLEEMYNIAKKEKSDIVICDMVDHYDNYEVYHDCTNFNSVYEKSPSVCNKIFNKKLIEDIKFVESKLWYEDLNFTTKVLLKTSNISVINKGFYHCHCRAESTMTNNNSLKNLDIIIIMDDLKDYLIKNNLFDEVLFGYLIYTHILVTGINRVVVQNDPNKGVVIKILKNYCKLNIKSRKKIYKAFILKKKVKLLAFLNINGLHYISKLLLNLKKKTKKWYGFL